MAKKDFGRRLMPEYLLNYSEELHKNHPDPSASWGGGSGDYTAGEGIEISDQDVISIDEEVVAKKTDIPTVPSVLSAFTNDVGYITGITRTDVTTALGYVPGTSNFSGDYEDLSGKPTIPDSTSDLVNDSGFISGVTSNMITTALGYTPGTSNFSGSYTDLTDKPTIPTVNDPTITFMQGTAIKGTIHLNQIENSSIVFDAGGSGTVDWDDITDKPTFATVATSGDYNDLSNKPKIPVIPYNYVTTDTTQNIIGEKGFTGDKRIKFFDDNSAINKMGFTCYHSDYSTNPNSKNENGYLEAQYLDRDVSNSPSIVLGMWNNSNIEKTRYLGFKYQSNNNGTTNKCNLMVPTNRTESTIRYIPVSVNGSFADNTGNISIAIPETATSTSTVIPTTQTLIFTLEDNSTVTVDVMTGATVSTTTTLS